jgi:cytochrome oxidase Cu insertion factor (SCO1/SenC/PrrC family)
MPCYLTFKCFARSGWFALLEISMKRFFLPALMLIVAALPAAAQYQYGDPVSDFTLPDAQGNPVSLSDYPGKIVFLVFWENG